MATTVSTRPTRSLDSQCVEWNGLDWKKYAALLRIRGERPSPRMIYLDGSLYLVTTSFPHERLKIRLGMLVMEVVVGLNIPCIQAGSTTFRRQAKRGGVEGDETYYLANEERIRGKDNIDLRVDPPPDLAIEAVHTHSAKAAIEVYRRLGVPEVWVCDEGDLIVLVLQKNGRYAPSKTSAAFTFLAADEIHGWVTRPLTGTDLDWIIELRRWVRDVLLPRSEETGRSS